MKNEELLISYFSEKQKHGWYPCPRCGCDRMAADVSRNALSRRTDIMVCDICGNIEAIEDMPGNTPVSLDKWYIIEHPDRFLLRGRDYFQYYFVFREAENGRHSYVIVEGFDRPDAIERFRRQFPDVQDGVVRYSIYFDEFGWKRWMKDNSLVFLGVLRLNDVFEND